MNENYPIGSQAVNQLKENWYWYFILGIGMMISGALAVYFNVASTLFSVFYLGILLIVIGFFEIVQSFKLTKWGSFFLHLILGILYIVGGFLIAIHPEINAITLTLLLAIFFAASGILKMVFAAITHIPHQGLLFLNGAITLVLGILIYKQWPSSSLWVIGTLVGIDALVTGASWIILSLKAKEIKEES